MNSGGTPIRKVLRAADRVRRILEGKYYPLKEPRTTSTEVWAAYEGMLPETGEGFAAFFRRSGAPERQAFALRGIDAGARYAVEDAATGETREMPGKELAGSTVHIADAPGGRLIFFRKLPTA